MQRRENNHFCTALCRASLFSGLDACSSDASRLARTSRKCDESARGRRCSLSWQCCARGDPVPTRRVARAVHEPQIVHSPVGQNSQGVEHGAVSEAISWSRGATDRIPQSGGARGARVRDTISARGSKSANREKIERLKVYTHKKLQPATDPPAPSKPYHLLARPRTGASKRSCDRRHAVQPLVPALARAHSLQL